MAIKDPATIFTRKGTPLLMLISRAAFLAYFLFVLAAIVYNWFPASELSIYWLMYLVLMYMGSEYLYRLFLAKRIDLTFAFPLLYAVYILNLISLLVRGQEEIPVINRAEHFASFILLAYIVWIFFLKYLPQDVWRDHPYYTALLVLAITSLAGVMNEIVELFLDVMFKTRTIGEGYDTSIDLVMNTLGAGLFLSVQLILNEAKIIKNE